MNLSELVFKVDTKELDNAVQRVESLREALSVLNKQRTAGSNAEKASLDLQRKEAKLRKELADAARSEAALKKTLERQNKGLADSAEKVATTTDKATKTTVASTSALEKQQRILDFMADGFSKGQASILRMAEASGLAKDQMKELEVVLQTMRKLQGGDPFDKSTAGLLSLKNALVELEFEHKSVGQGINLTSKQYKELSRDLQRTTEASIANGDSFEVMAGKLGAVKSEYIEVARQVNKLTNEEKERERAMRDSANASRYLATEDEKVNSVLATLGQTYSGNMHTSEKAAESVARYARRLKQSGVDGAEAAARLEVYRQKVLQINKIEQQRQKDYLSRALAPQISDVVVSLAGGMNPMTVLLQQGLQVRDLIGQSGVAANDLQESFRNAATQMVASIKGTAVALGSLLIGTILDSGKAVTSFASRITAMDKVFAGWRNRLIATNGLVGESSSSLRLFDAVARGASIAAGGTLATAFVVLTSSIFAFAEVISEQGELSRNLAMTGASMGLTKDSAIALANSLDGVSETKAINVLNEMAKAGGFTKEQFETVTKAAVDMEKYAGVAIEDTVKNFASLQKDPSKALAEFAAKNGQVEVAVLKQIKALEDQGKTAAATELAIQAYGDSQVAVAAIVKSELHPIESLWIDIKSAMGGAWEQLKEFARSDVIVAPFRIAFEFVRNIVYDVWAGIKLIGGTIGTIIAAAAQLATGGGLEGAANVIRAAKDDFSAGLKAREKFMSSVQDTPRSTDKTKKNAEDAKAFLDSLKKKPKEKKSEATKESERIEKEVSGVFSRIASANNEATQELNNYTASQKLALDIFADPDFKNYPETTRREIANKLEAVIQQELYNKKLAEEREILYAKQQAYVDLQKRRDDAMFDALEQSDQMNQTLADETQMIEFQASLVNNMSDDREKLIKIMQLELKLQKELRDAAKQTEQSVRTELENAARARFDQSIKNLNTEIATDAALKMQESLSDAVETALFEGGKAGAEKLRSVIEAALKKPIRVIIEAVINNLSGGISKALDGIMSGSGSVKGIFDALSGGLNAATGAGQGLFNATSKFVGQFGSNFMTDAITQFSSGMMSTGSMAAAKEAFTAGGAQMGGLIVGSVMNGLSGYAISEAISGGYTTGGKTVSTIAAIASMIPGIGPIAGVIGGLVNRAFGRKLKDTGIQGTFGGETGFEGENYQFYKGGWFRSDKTKRSAMDAGLKKGIGGAFISAQIGLAAMASTLGLATDSIFSFTKAVKISFNGLSQEDAVKKLQEQIGIASNEMAETLLGTYETTTTRGFRMLAGKFKGATIGGKTTTTWKPGEFVREGESALEALTRLSTSLIAVNSAFDTLNVTLLQTSLIGGDAASKLMDNFGGIENFNTAIGAYYEAFYTEEERVATTTRQLTSALASMGLTLPATNEAYRALVESQDLYTDSGRATYAALVQLAPTFDSITDAAKAAADAAAEAAKAAADAAAEAAEEFAKVIRDLANSLLDEVKRLRNEIVGSTVDSGLAYLQSQFAVTTAQARAGDTTAIAALPELSQAIENAAKLNATSNLDIIRMQAWLADSLSQTATTLGVPAFAAGGIHTGGARLVGENGPELEITGPSRIFSSNQTGDILNNSAVVERLESMNYELQMLRSEVRADVSHNAKTAKLLDRVIPDGDALVVNANIDGGAL